MIETRPATIYLRRLDDGPLPRMDFHIHTSYTDGVASIRAMVQAGVQQRLEALALTEHVRRSSNWLASFWQEVEAVRQEVSDIRVFHGIESKALDFTGTLDADPLMLARAELVLGAVHRYPDGQGGFYEWSSLSFEDAAQIELRAALGLLTNEQVDVLAHPGGVYHHKFGPFPEPFLREIVATAAKRGIAVEVNAHYCNNVTELLSLCQQYGARVSLGSDAHSAMEVGKVVAMIQGV